MLPHLEKFTHAIRALEEMFPGHLYTVTIYDNGNNGHFEIYEDGEKIYIHQGRNLYGHWKDLAMRACKEILNTKLEKAIRPRF